jgi:hypothetical protein
MFITGVNDTGDKLFTMSTTPAINSSHGFSVIASVNDTGDIGILCAHNLNIVATPKIGRTNTTFIKMSSILFGLSM